MGTAATFADLARLDMADGSFNFTFAMLSHATPKKRGLRAAFTLLEIMIALAILGLLVGLAVTNIGNIFGNSQHDIAKMFVGGSMKTALKSYQIDMGGYPSTSEGLDVLMNKPASGGSRWRGPYVEETTAWPPLDPWGERYQYAMPGKHNPKSYDIWSKGPDKTDGTADDVGNWEPAASTEETK
jgi:general secretion pathway protein G